MTVAWRPVLAVLMLAAMMTAAELGGGAAVAQPASPQPYPPVPPLRAETPPPPGTAQGPRTVWEPGHWRWDGVAYFWTPGRYVIARADYRSYVPGVWFLRYGHWVWRPAHWR